MRQRILPFSFCAVLGAGVVLATFALTTTPSHAQRFGVGNALMNQSAYALDRERWREGTDLAEQALKSGEVMLEDLPGAYSNLCIGLTGLRKFDDAIAACNRAVELRPRQWAFYNNRANIFFYLGQFDRALAEYYKAMTFSSGSNVLMNNIGLALQYRKNYGPRPGTIDSEKNS